LQQALIFVFLIFAPKVLGFNSEVYHGIKPSLQSGAFHNCVNGQAGNLRCWGSNHYGRLGFGNRSRNITGPGIVKNLMGIQNLASVGDHNCALDSIGRVYCWGLNNFGQLGDGTRKNRSAPAAVKGLSGIAVSVGAGFHHSCAVIRSGEIFCWGNNREKRLGHGQNITYSKIPVRVNGIENAKSIVIGDHHSCALLKNHRVACWGQNIFGAIGDGKKGDGSKPVLLKGLKNIMAITSGATHMCALDFRGKIYCWGANVRGQLCLGRRSNDYFPARTMDMPGPAISIGGGAAHTCAVISDGRLFCWGSNTRYQLGPVRDGNESHFPVPVPLPGFVKSVSGGDFHTCAELNDESVYCWGSNIFGQTAPTIGAKIIRRPFLVLLGLESWH